MNLNLNLSAQPSSAKYEPSCFPSERHYLAARTDARPTPTQPKFAAQDYQSLSNRPPKLALDDHPTHRKSSQ